MKIRNGFVSNSSSSSFCVYGCRVPESVDIITFFRAIKTFSPDQYDKFLVQLRSYAVTRKDQETIAMYDCAIDINNNEYFSMQKLRSCECPVDTTLKFCPNCGKPMWTEKSKVDAKKFTRFLKDLRCEVLQAIGFRQTEDLVGRKYISMQDDQTMGDFKKETEALLKKMFGKNDIVCKHIEEVIEG